MTKLTNLTIKGQVTIPKDVRDALGLKPGEPVAIDLQDDGVATIRKGTLDEDERARRRQVMRKRLDMVAEKYRHLRTGQGGEAYMRELRDPLP